MAGDIAAEIDAVFVLALFLIGLTTYMGFKEQRAMLLAGMVWIGVSALVFMGISPDLAAMGAVIGLLMSFWGVYIYAFGHN